MNYVKFIVFLIFHLFPVYNALADEIHLKNKDRISGQLINLSPTLCTFATPYQAILQIKRDQLLRLHTIQPVTIELFSGERLIGSLTANQDGQTSIYSQKFGKLPIQLAEIRTVESLDKEITSLYSRLPNEKYPKHRNSQYPPSHLFVGDQPRSPLTVHGRGTKNDSEEPLSEAPATIGEKDEGIRQRLFVPQSEVVLVKPGEKELDIFFSYMHDRFDNTRERNLGLSAALHIGLIDRLETFIDIPLIWAEQEFLDDDFAKNSNFGIGDVSVGFNYLFVPEDDQWPDILGSFVITTPTGDNLDFADLNKVSLGNGHWGITSELWFMRTYDPAILFGSIGYNHTFAETFNGIREAPGDGVSYIFGAGLAINNKVTIFSRFEGYFQMESESDGMTIPGSTNEQMYLRNYLTYALQGDNFIQPGLTIGLNDEAADVGFDLSYFYSF
jgi:hypothetical protein